MISAIITAIIAVFLIIGGVALIVNNSKRVLLGPNDWKKLKKESYLLLAAFGLIAVAGLLLVLAIFLNNPDWASKTEYGAKELFAGASINYAYQMSIGLIGGFLFGLSNAVFWTSFLIHFRKKNIDKPFKKRNLIVLFVSLAVIVISFVGWTESVAPYLTYPLISGFSINFASETIWQWTSVTNKSEGGLHVAFYGIIMLSGVVVCYLVCSHAFIKEYGKKGMLDGVAVAGFIGGVIGARIWYVVGNFSREFAARIAAGDIGSIFRIWDGGITILGGAMAGVLCGYLWLRFFVKAAKPRFAIDVCVPSILLAQAIGRWGNFFNCEVYGAVVPVEYFRWLPSWLLSQMQVTNSGTFLDPGYINVPLFLIEGIFTFGGYFLIVYGTKPIKKYLVQGDLCGMYFTYYGLVRVIMEPMRNTSFNMGTDNSWSVCNSIAYIFIGLAFITALHVYEYILKKPERKWVGGCVALGLAFVSLFMPFIPSVNGVTSTSVTSYMGFDIIFSGKSPLYMVWYILLILAVIAIAAYVYILYKNDAKFAKAERICSYVLIASLVILCLAFLLSVPSITFSETYSDVNASYGFVLTSLFAVSAATVLVGMKLASRDLAKKAETPLVTEEAKQ